ncbi:MAG: glycosyltransferase family 4 protein [Planctomycetes bacterium]|nr:glycosyltransferase family 4 protein [Planctomycetota bacterium]
MTRVLLASFDRVPAPKGASQHILANLEALATRHDVSLVTLGDRPLPGVRHLPVALDEPNWLRRALLFRERLTRVLAEEPADAYHVRSPWEGLAAPAGPPLVYEANGFMSVEAGYHFPRVPALPGLRDKLRRLEDALLDRATVVVTPSAVTAAYVEDRGVEAARVRVVPNAPAVPLAAGPVEPAGEALRLLYVGTLAAWQGVDDLLRALPAVRAPWTLTVLTSAPERRRRRLLRRAARLGLGGRVDVREAVDPADLPAVLRAHDVGVAPLVPCERNLVQGCQPIKLLDFMASGLPVLAADLPVVREVVGDDAPLYARARHDALVDLLERLAAGPAWRAELARAGLARVQARFSREAQRAALLGVYEEVFDGG